MEDAIEQIVSYLKHAAQGLEEETDPLSAGGPGWAVVNRRWLNG